MTESHALDDAALDRLRGWGGEKLLKEIVRLFLANSPARMDQIRTGMAQDDPLEVERGAHSLKSTAANIGATRVSELSSDFESVASTGRLDELRGKLPELEETYAAACRALEAMETGDAE
jgi:HPt (histidine-containing phosphotransfer) domain-containing protein